jgi:hypothetical protein
MIDLTKFVVAAGNAPLPVLLTTIALALIAPITIQHSLAIVVPLILILGCIVLRLTLGDGRRRSNRRR